MKISLLDVAILGILAVTGTEQEARANAPTYHGEVVRILQKNCQDCHRNGAQVRRFHYLSLRTAQRASDMASVTEARKMPPSPASTGRGGANPRRAGAVGRRRSDTRGVGRGGVSGGKPELDACRREWASD